MPHTESHVALDDDNNNNVNYMRIFITCWLNFVSSVNLESEYVHCSFE